ncbi:MAG: cytochrome c family protein [Rhodobacteraceae bacterium]|nr:cytochrome c family protein [Paracoccaceae bacterium]
MWRQCAACHALEKGRRMTGPDLVGIVGRAVGSVEGFRYSDAMAGHGGNWTPELLDQYLANPRETIPGNKMTFAGLRKAEDRADVIAYLATITE